MTQPSSESNEILPWWKTSLIYHIFPMSFKDSTGDGVGDLKGINSKMDYFEYLGANAVWFCPFFTTPKLDFGYDVSDYCDIDPQFGTLDDLKYFIKEAHKRDIKVILDIVVGHTSSESYWFQQSVKRQGKYADYYIWDDGILQPDGTRVPPNNWKSVFGGTAWEWCEERQQFYYHAFLVEQPALNHRNPEVEEEMKSVLRYWLNKGVDGFRMDAIPHMFITEDRSLNEPPSGLPGYEPSDYYYLDHIYTYSQPEVKPAMEDYMSVLKEFEAKDGHPRLMVLETFENTSIRNGYYETGAVPFNMDLTQSEALALAETPPITGHFLNTTIMNYYKNLPEGAWPNFVISSHDVRRVTMRYGPQHVDVYNMMLLTLRGTPTAYYGEEIGMVSPDITWETNRDFAALRYGKEKFKENTRDFSRTPMQWDDTKHAGFSDGNQTWLPIDPSYKDINVEKQMTCPDQSHLQLFRQLALLRRQPAFRSGSFSPAYVDENIFSYTREGGNQRYLVAMNFGKEESKAMFDKFVNTKSGELVAHTGLGHLTNGQTLSLDSLTLKPGDGAIFLLEN